MRELNDQNVVTSFTNRYRRRDGVYRWISISLGGKMMARDITTASPLRTLRAAKEAAEEANGVKSRPGQHEPRSARRSTAS